MSSKTRRRRETIVAERGDLTEPAVDALREAGVPVRVVRKNLTPVELAEEAAGSSILLLGLTPLDASSIHRLQGTKLIVRCGAGTDHIDIQAAKERGIRVMNVPDYCVEEVAEHTILLVLAAVRHLRHFMDSFERGEWKELEYPAVHRLRGRRLAIVGFGRIGSRVATAASALGAEVTVASPRADPRALAERGFELVSLDEAIRHSDIISLHCPLTPSTRHLLNKSTFLRMRVGVVIINTSRGGLIDLDALDEALAQGIVGAAGLDVLDGEPFPDLSHPVLRHPNVVVTPHIAFYSVDARRELGNRVAEEVTRYLDGEELRYVVNT
jgi:D-3-phosphoglycerate dehydrogenase